LQKEATDLEGFAVHITKGLRVHACRARGLLNLHSMFVGSGQQLSILVSKKYPPSLQNIGDHHGIEMTNMGGFQKIDPISTDSTLGSA
jgi:hypothetical protein